MVDAPIPHWPGEFVSLSRGDVFVRTAPAAERSEPALFVHGLGGSSRNWTDLMGMLAGPDPASGVAALEGDAIDLPGFGESRPATERNTDRNTDRNTERNLEGADVPRYPAGIGDVAADYSVDGYTATVIELIERRGRWPVHLIGNSLGGAICTRLAARRPDLVRTLTLISPALPDLRPRALPLRVVLMCTPGFGRRLLTRLQRLPARQRAEATLSEVFAEPARMHPQRLEEEVAEVIRRDQLDYSLDVIIRSARSLVTEYGKGGGRSLWADAARVVAPTLVIHGSHDRLVNPVTGARAAKTFRRGRVVVLSGIGHCAMMERPDMVAGEMRAFLARHAATTSRAGSVEAAAC